MVKLYFFSSLSCDFFLSSRSELGSLGLNFKPELLEKKPGWHLTFFPSGSGSCIFFKRLWLRLQGAKNTQLCLRLPSPETNHTYQTFNLTMFFLAELFPRVNIRTSLFEDLDDTTKQRHVNVSTMHE